MILIIQANNNNNNKKNGKTVCPLLLWTLSQLYHELKTKATGDMLYINIFFLTKETNLANLFELKWFFW